MTDHPARDRFAEELGFVADLTIEAMLQEVLDEHAHHLAEQIRAAWNAHDPKKPGNVTMLSALNAADHIDPEQQP